MMDTSLENKKQLEFMHDLEDKIDDHIATETKKGESSSGYQYLGAIDPNNLTVTDGHRLITVDDVRRRMSENTPIKPMWTVHDPDTGEPSWILNDLDAEAVELGYACPNCLLWQESNITLDCKTRSGFGCGYKRDF